ncbi:MAG: hypothetical protein AABZ06_10555 [Bdellovibrionota bacterium]
MKINHKIILGILLLLAAPFAAHAITFDTDVPKETKVQLMQDLDFVSYIFGNEASALHKQIFGDFSGKVYSDFFTSRVLRVGMNSCGNGKAVACVIPFFDSSKMWLTQNYIKFSHPQIARLMIVFHESRHTESMNGFYTHATCPDPFLDADGNEIKSIWTGSSLSGEPACDNTPFGSYGSSLIMLKNIQKFCQNCTEKVKLDAGFYGDDQFKRIINPGAVDSIKKDLYSLR